MSQRTRLAPQTPLKQATRTTHLRRSDAWFYRSLTELISDAACDISEPFSVQRDGNHLSCAFSPTERLDTPAEPALLLPLFALAALPSEHHLLGKLSLYNLTRCAPYRRAVAVLN